jgi:hypothetical protein
MARPFAKLLRTKLLNRKQCEDVARLVDMDKARIVKEFKDGKPTLFAISASGSTIGSQDKKFAYLLESRLAANGSGDGLFPGCDQTTGGRDGH